VESFVNPDGLAAQWYLAAIVESSDDAIIAKDLDGFVRSCNPAAERLFGYPSAELVGQSIRILIPPDRQDEEDRILETIRQGGRVDHFETIRLTKTGQPVPISLTVSPVKDARGQIIGVSKTARDITERRRAEAALARQREWLQTTLESIGDAVVATDVDGHVVFMNAVAERLTGWRQNRAKGRPCTDVFRIVNEYTRAAVDNPVTRVLRDGIVVGLANHTMLIAADGTERPIDDSGAPIRTPNGRVDGAVLVFRDVSERRRLEAERDLAATERERLLVSERAARLEAERANRLKDDFVAMVSHELRTPLNAIMGWTDLMRRTPEDADTLARGLDIITRNTRLQTQLISDLLDLSRIVSDKLRLDIQAVDLAAIVRAAIDTVQPDASARRIQILSQVDEPPTAMAGDPARLQQVIWNLLSNAVKFTPVGGTVRVTLRCHGGQADVVVADNGIGISPGFLPYVFDRFQQADVSRTRRVGGLGLGLSIVKTLVELHDGKVSAASAGAGHGATFTVTLPIADPPAAPLAVTTTSPTAGLELTYTVSLAGIHIHTVEDDPDAADLVRRLLESRGARVSVAATAARALEHFAREVPDILISDISLPEIDGYDLMETIRARSPAEGGAVPAIALTAYARSEDRTRALLAGYQAHLAKPIAADELLAAVSSFAELARAGRSGESV
jgi:PAS domain S-box-containing protein